MKLSHLLCVISMATVVIACSNSDSSEDKTVNSFNSHSYGFSLSYSKGAFSITADDSISKDEIAKVVIGKKWQVLNTGMVTLEGLSTMPLDGMGSLSYSFFEDHAHILSRPDDPTSPNVIDKDFSVEYSDNLIAIGDEQMIVWSLSEDCIYALSAGNDKNHWLYNRWELIP